MLVFHSVSKFKKYRNSLNSSSMPVGLVPTMGALHNGHLSLVKKAEECNTTLVSIFVNPTQFNDPKDLENYPRDTEKDLALLRNSKVDAVLIPDVSDIYPEIDKRQFDFGNLANIMEGKQRPGHFNGVAQVVSRLFDIFSPDKAYFGQKDFQQLAIIKSLVTQFNYPIDIISCPIVREQDGLAMSSRNQLLTADERLHASKLNKVLLEANELKSQLTVDEIKIHSLQRLESIPMVSPEYFEIVDSMTLNPIESWNHKGQIVACLAVKINRIRLIDNLIFD